MAAPEGAGLAPFAVFIEYGGEPVLIDEDDDLEYSWLRAWKDALVVYVESLSAPHPDTYDQRPAPAAAPGGVSERGYVNAFFARPDPPPAGRPIWIMVAGDFSIYAFAGGYGAWEAWASKQSEAAAAAPKGGGAAPTGGGAALGV